MKKVSRKDLEEKVRQQTDELKVNKGQLKQGADREKLGADREKLGADREKVAEEKARQQTDKLEIRDGQLKQGADREKLGADREKLGADREKRQDLEIEKQREELLHVTRVGKMAEFVSSLAHEISQPLTAILAYAQAAQRILKNKDPQLQEILQYIIDDDQRAAEVIRRLRSLLKKSKPTFETLDVNVLINDTVKLIMTHITVRNKIIKFKLDNTLSCIYGDRIQLQQVLLNLISNSLEAMEESADSRELLIRTSRKDADTILVEVKDSGCGIPVENMDKLFVHFFTSKPDGLGMGLSISRSIIETHGGRLDAKNNSDRGATFYFTIPIGIKEGV